jgi:hypothetical protein
MGFKDWPKWLKKGIIVSSIYLVTSVLLFVICLSHMCLMGAEIYMTFPSIILYMPFNTYWAQWLSWITNILLLFAWVAIWQKIYDKK